MSNKSIKPKILQEFNPNANYLPNNVVTFEGSAYKLSFNVMKSSGTQPDMDFDWEEYSYPTYAPDFGYKKYQWLEKNGLFYQLINPEVYPGLQDDPETNASGAWSAAGSPPVWSAENYYTIGNSEYFASIVTHNSIVYMIIGNTAQNSELPPENGIYNNWVLQVPPDVPTTLEITYISADNSLEFKWDNPNIDPAQIKIYNRPYLSSDDFSVTSVIPWVDIISTTSKCFFNYLLQYSFLNNGSSYEFCISAANDDGVESIKSNIVPVDIPPLDGLSPQIGLQVTYNSNTNTLDFIWGDIGTRPPQFYVYYANTGNQLINRLGDPILTSDITDFSNDSLHYNYPVPNNTLTNGNTYDLAITASDNMDESDFSNIVTVEYILPVVNPEPPIVTAVINQNASTTIYWIPPSTTGEPELSGYEINYSFDGGTTNITIDISDPSANSYQITGLDEFNGASGQGNIKAINVDGGFSVDSYFLLAPIQEITVKAAVFNF